MRDFNLCFLDFWSRSRHRSKASCIHRYLSFADVFHNSESVANWWHKNFRSMGEQSAGLHRANTIKKGGPTCGCQDLHHLSQVDFVQGKGLPLIGFYFTGIMVVVGRPGYMIDCCTIKGGSRVSSLIVLFVESSNHCILASSFLVLVWFSL